MPPVYTIAKLHPQPGKFNQVVDAFNNFTKYVQAQEPTTQFYFALRPNNTEEIVIVEKYADQDSVKVHGSSKAFKEFGKAAGGLLAKAPEIQVSEFLGGFDGRAKL